jgi:hypothetical protein
MRSFLVFVVLSIWTISVAANLWTKLPGQNPGKITGGRSVFCSNRNSILFSGGYQYIPANDTYMAAYYADVKDLWEYDITAQTWSNLVQYPAPIQPRGYFTFTTISSSVSNECQVVMIGGTFRVSDKISTDTSEVWLLTVNGSSSSASGNWELLSNSTDAFTPRRYHQAVYRSGPFIYVFGGGRQNPTLSSDELWQFKVGALTDPSTRSPSQWTVMNKTTPWPRARFGHAMALNLGSTPEQDQLYVHGGRDWTSSASYTTKSDLWVYTFSTNVWKQLTTDANAIKIDRAHHSAIIQSNRLFLFGGFSRIQTPAGTTPYLIGFSSVSVTNLQAQPTSTSLGATDIWCTSKIGQIGTWCESMLGADETSPDYRYDFSFTQVGSEGSLFVYGGSTTRFPVSDFWSLNMTASLQNLALVSADPLGTADLASTLYFMIAILSMMVVCFMIFILSLRRQRANNPTQAGRGGQGGARHRVVLGARPSFIQSLPLKHYKKNHQISEEMRRTSELRRESLRQRRDSSKGDLQPQGSTTMMSSSPSAAVALDDPTQEIDQDDLHDLCAICLTDYDDGEELRVLPCSHFFHPACVDPWIGTHNACPMCKAQVDPEPTRVEEPSAGTVVPLMARNPHYSGLVAPPVVPPVEAATATEMVQLHRNDEDPVQVVTDENPREGNARQPVQSSNV